MKIAGKIITVVGLILLLLSYEPVLAKTVNYAPKIVSLSASKKVATSGEKITLTVKAYDQNKDKIYYEWSASGSKGSFSSKTSTRVTWTAPLVTSETTVTIKLKAYDKKKASSYKTLQIKVKPKSLSQLFKELKDSSVLITSNSGLGSGVVISADGRILTCYHVIKGAVRADVGLADGRWFNVVKLESYDPEHDWAVININAAGLKPVKLTTKLPQVGEQVFTIGNPQGLSWSMASGIVSSNDRLLNGNNYLQITAPVNPGNSGGPLFNRKGEMVGIVNMKLSDSEGLNFAIPYKTVVENKDNVLVFNAPLEEVFSPEAYQERIDNAVNELNNQEVDYLNPLMIGDIDFGRVTYENGIWDDDSGQTHYGIDIVVDYQQFLSIYGSHLDEQGFDESMTFFSSTLVKFLSDYFGIPEMEIWFRVRDTLSGYPEDGIIPESSITDHGDGTYTVDWYFYKAVESGDDFKDNWG